MGSARAVLCTILAILHLTIAALPYDAARNIRDLHQQQAKTHVKRVATRSSPTPRFLTDKTKKYAVNGTDIPEVDFDAGESYAGLLPISGEHDESRQLFFWFWPSIAPDPKKEIVIWLNGGPGCSSLLGFIAENGPFTWMEGTYKPVANSYDWRNLTNVVWVEQPVGVGFTQGNVSIKNELELSKQFVGFYEQFAKTFDVQGWDLYLTGESYAGKYIPYIGAEILSRKNCSDIPLKGVSFNDPILSDPATTQSITIKDHYFAFQNYYGFNTTTLINATTKHIECGYDDYLAKYFTFPPPQEKFPILPTPFSANPWIEHCDTFNLMAYASVLLNPCFNIYRITDKCPHQWSVLGTFSASDYNPAPSTTYFNRTDVQKAIHVPTGWKWHACGPKPVFIGNETSPFGGDQSPPVAQSDVLTTVIEGTNNVIIGSGGLDALLNTNGTLLSLQNITWNGFQGFRRYPNKPLFVPYHPEYNQGSQAGAGVVGSWNEERGLTFYQVALSGHTLPADAPGAAFRVLEKLLGRIDSLERRGTFTTQGHKGENWTGGFLYLENEGVPLLDPYSVEAMVREGLGTGNVSKGGN